MQTNSVDSQLTLSQRIYIIARSLRSLGDWLRNLLIVNLVFLSIGWAQQFYHFDITCLCISRNTTLYQFVYLELTLLTAVTLAYFLSSGPRAYKWFKEWNEEYLEETYTVVFNTTIPRGSTIGERVFNLAKFIFPELSPEYVRLTAGIRGRIKLYFKKRLGRLKELNVSEHLNIKVDSYSLDLALKTPEGYFIVKSFEVVTPEELRHLISFLSHKFRKITEIPPKVDIFRVICIAKDYDRTFLNRETLEKLMEKDLKSSLKVDLIVEEKVGYSVLWVS